jgi:hypothetical protein
MPEANDKLPKSFFSGKSTAPYHFFLVPAIDAFDSRGSYNQYIFKYQRSKISSTCSPHESPGQAGPPKEEKEEEL